MSTTTDLCRLSGADQARLIRAQELSPVELIDAVYARIHALNPIVNAFCTLVEEEARAEARAAEAAVLRGDDLGPLHGVPVSIKDLVCTRGIRTVSGSKAYADFVPDEDDIVVERLRAAGAIVLGKTNVPEFGYMGTTHNDVFGVTRNPWNLEKTPGGSSGGGTAAVATGMGALAVGSDGGGSVRIPGSFSGLFAMKASFGRVPLYPGCRDPRYPGVSSWESLEHIGPMTRTVEDSALMLSVMAAGPDDRDRHTLPAPGFDWLAAMTGGVRGLRVAWSPDWGYAAVDPRVREVTTRAVRVFADQLGCEVVEAHPGFGDCLGLFPGMDDAFWALVARDSDLKGMRALVAAGTITLPSLVALLQTEWTAEDLTNAAMVRQDVVNTMWRFMRDYDFLLTPTLGVPPFELSSAGPTEIDGKAVSSAHWLSFTYPINMTGQPAATVPAGWTDDGLPIGLQIVGRHLDDPMVLRAAAAFEAASPWAQRWPALLDDL
jgi:aspartyl-tRNA(Asn)/glutamyl-tRNA(Gln) amidotransferase subunit A